MSTVKACIFPSCNLFLTLYSAHHFLRLQVYTASRWPRRRVPDRWPWARWELGCTRNMAPSKGMTSLRRRGQAMMSATTWARWWCPFRSWRRWSSSASSRPRVLATGASAWCPAHILHLLPRELTLRKALWEKAHGCGRGLRKTWSRLILYDRRPVVVWRTADERCRWLFKGRWRFVLQANANKAAPEIIKLTVIVEVLLLLELLWRNLSIVQVNANSPDDLWSSLAFLRK